MFSSAAIFGMGLKAGSKALLGSSPIDENGDQSADYDKYSYHWELPSQVQADSITNGNLNWQTVQVDVPDSTAGQSLTFKVTITSPDGAKSLSASQSYTVQ
ncbi:hypothetical protein [Streptacidiphilus albus]|uniref:hypothetical protein n=1 Tax=Streptacidiphilus albus TaxID=105425 RepID=UPI00054AFFFD|nr:hypothetical protein [Streptacidiphilus albus]